MMCSIMGNAQSMMCMIILKIVIVLWVFLVPLMIILRLDKILKVMEEKKK